MARTPISKQTVEDVKFEQLEARMDKQEQHSDGHFMMLEQKIDSLDKKLTIHIENVNDNVTKLTVDVAQLKALLSNKMILAGGVLLALLAGSALTFFAMLSLNWAGQLTELKEVIRP